MGRICKEVTGQVFCSVGFLGVIVACGLPTWRVTTRIGANVVSGQVVWEGLWMTCVMQSTGQTQCSIYESLLKLPRDLQASRALVVVAAVAAFAGILLSVVGAKCTSCLDGDASKAKTVILGGAVCIVAGAACVIPVSWSAAVTVADFQSALVSADRKRDLGEAIYIGWVSAALLIIGGSILCTSCPPEEDKRGWDDSVQGFPGQGYPPQGYPPQYYPWAAMTAGPYQPAEVYIPNRAPSASSQYISNNTYPSGSSYSPVNYR